VKISKEKVISIIKEEIEKIYREELEEIPTNQGPNMPPIPSDVMKAFEIQKKSGKQVYLDYDLTERKWKLMGEEQ
jgi:hypothetical protein